MNKIRSAILLLLMAFSLGLPAVALAQQGHGGGRHGEGREPQRFDREAFDARKNAFITAELGLTPDEAAAFIPLCNELHQKKFELGRESRRLAKELQRMNKPTDADYNRVIDAALEADIQGAELEKAYYARFREILSPEKVHKYREAELRFARDFMRNR